MNNHFPPTTEPPPPKDIRPATYEEWLPYKGKMIRSASGKGGASIRYGSGSVTGRLVEVRKKDLLWQPSGHQNIVTAEFDEVVPWQKGQFQQEEIQRSRLGKLLENAVPAATAPRSREDVKIVAELVRETRVVIYSSGSRRFLGGVKDGSVISPTGKLSSVVVTSRIPDQPLETASRLPAAAAVEIWKSLPGNLTADWQILPLPQAEEVWADVQTRELAQEAKVEAEKAEAARRKEADKAEKARQRAMAAAPSRPVLGPAFDPPAPKVAPAARHHIDDLYAAAGFATVPANNFPSTPIAAIPSQSAPDPLPPQQAAPEPAPERQEPAAVAKPAPVPQVSPLEKARAARKQALRDIATAQAMVLEAQGRLAMADADIAIEGEA